MVPQVRKVRLTERVSITWTLYPQLNWVDRGPALADPSVLGGPGRGAVPLPADRAGRGGGLTEEGRWKRRPRLGHAHYGSGGRRQQSAAGPGCSADPTHTARPR